MTSGCLALYRYLAAALVALTLACARHHSSVDASVGALSTAPSPALPLDPDVVQGQLSNGLKYLISRAPNALHAVQLLLVVRAGSFVEEEDELGFAHFVEHVAFDPGQRFGSLAPLDFLQRLGLSLGADANAHTRPDSTVYRILLSDPDGTRLADGLAILAGWAGHVQFGPELVERQREIVIAELRSHEADETSLSGALARELERGSRYEARPTTGRAAALRAARADGLEAFYRAWYRPQNQAIVAVGELDPLELVQRIDRLFGASAMDPGQRVPQRFPLPVPPGEQWVVRNAEDLGQSDNVAMILRHLPAAPVQNEADYRQQLVDRSIAAMLDTRLQRLVPEPDASIEGVDCKSVRLDAGGVARLACIANGRPGQLRPAVERLALELERAEHQGFSELELERAKGPLLRTIAGEAESRRSAAISALAERLVAHFLHGTPALGAAQEQALSERLLAALELGTVQQRWSDWAERSQRLAFVVRGRADGSLTSEAQLQELLQAVKQRPLPAYQILPAARPLLAVPPEPGRITASERRKDLGLEIWTLGNGARVVTKRIAAVDGRVQLRGISPGGVAQGSTASAASDRIADLAVREGGAGEHDASELRQLLTGTTVTVQPELGEHFEAIEGAASSEDLEVMFQLVHLYLTEPRRDARAFGAYRARLRQEPTPQEAFEAAIADAWCPKCKPEARGERDDPLDLDRALAFYRDRFGDAGDFTFVITGEWEEARLRPLVERYLASLPGSSRYERSALRKIAVSRGIRRVRREGRPGSESEVVLEFRGAARPSSEAEADLEVLEAHLWRRLQERLGGVYGVRVQSHWFEQSYALEIRFLCLPEQVEALEATSFAVIAEVQRSGAPADELATLRAQRDELTKRKLASDTFWLQGLATSYLEGTELRQLTELPKLSSRITRENLRASARRYLSSDQYLEAVWSPASHSQDPSLTPDP